MSSLSEPDAFVQRRRTVEAAASRDAGRRRYLPLLRRVAGLNVLLVITAVAVTVVVLAPRKLSSFAVGAGGGSRES